MGELYSHQRLWEQMSADVSAAELRRSLGATIQRQRDFARQRLVRNHWVGAPLRWLLTLGAIIWFPFAQPILQAILGGANLHAWRREVAALAVEVLGVNYLLASAGFLVIYFAALWLALRWNTQRKVAKLMSASRMMEFRDESLNLAAQTLAWLDGLIVPLRQAREHLDSLIAGAEPIDIISDVPGSAEKKAKSA